MKQVDIMRLLKEAATCSPNRAAEILDQFLESCPTITTDLYEEGRSTAKRTLLSTLFQDAREHCLRHLPSLFPVFANICGDQRPEDRDGAPVNWLHMLE